MNTALLIGVVASSIMSGTSLLYATLGEVVGERAGIVNLGLEGIMLIGAAGGFAATVLTGSPYLGVIAAALAGAAANMIFAYLVVGRHANQLATGLSLMFFGIGISALIGRPFVGALINGLPRLVLPGLAPGGAGARLLGYDILVYLAVPVSIFTWWLIFRTRWGLGLRTVGESPAAAFAAGLRPQRLQYQALTFAGALGGIGGRAYLGGAHADLGRRHDSRARLHRHRAGDFRQMESAVGHCRRAAVRRRGRSAIAASGDRRRCLAFHHEHDAVSADARGTDRLGLEPPGGRARGAGPKLCRG